MSGIILACLGLWLFVNASGQQQAEDVETVQVCELTKNPRLFHGRVVQIRSLVHPSVIDTPIALIDSKCRASIRLDIDHRADGRTEKAYRDFSRYLREWRTVEATLSGRFEIVLVPSEQPILRFKLQRVTDVIPGWPLLPLKRR